MVTSSAILINGSLKTFRVDAKVLLDEIRLIHLDNFSIWARLKTVNSDGKTQVSVTDGLRNDDISREQFGRDLKTFLFALAYSSEAPLRTSV